VDVDLSRCRRFTSRLLVLVPPDEYISGLYSAGPPGTTERPILPVFGDQGVVCRHADNGSDETGPRPPSVAHEAVVSEWNSHVDRNCRENQNGHSV
jgi:hypothetical protein